MRRAFARLLFVLSLTAVSALGLQEAALHEPALHEARPLATGQPQPAIHYSVSLITPSAHLVKVGIVLPAGAPTRDLQLPVWNALYQVRDFSQYVTEVKAHSQSGSELAIHTVNKS